MIFPTISLRIERWKFNKDYGIYVSTLGNFKDRHKRPLPIKINEGGYCLVKTEAPSKPWKLTHRIVMLTWKPIPDAENLTVDHLNHNKRDNSVGNLEWVTEEENLRRAKEDYLSTEKKDKKSSLAEFQKNILGYDVNGILCKDEEEIFEIMLKFYPGGYSKATIKEKVKNARTLKNPKYIVKLGKKATLKIVMKEEK